MKISISLLILLLFSAASLSGQVEGRVHYTEVLNMEDSYKDMPEEFKKMMPKTQVFEKELIFNQASSIYKTKEGLETTTENISNDEGTFIIMMDSDEDTNDFLYKDLKDKTKTHQRTEEGKLFLITDTLAKLKWKFTGDKISYLGYECQKATIENDTDFVVAWYTPQIPAFTGPRAYQDLPGLILLLSINNGNTEISAKSIQLEKLDRKALKKPRKGKKVSEKELKKILEDYKKERKVQYKGHKLLKRR